MNYYLLQPEVAGGFGQGTRLDSTVHPPVVHRLNYQLEVWLGDELLETFPCYIVSERLADLIEQAGLSGALMADVDVTQSEEFQELYPQRVVPSFRWLQVTGRPGHDDFGLDALAHLIVSQRALAVLEQATLAHCERESGST